MCFDPVLPLMSSLKFPIDLPNRPANILLLGRKSSGKSTLVANLALDDIHNGAGIALFDPYEIATNLILPRIPPARWKDVVLVEPHSQNRIP